jgi:hypothetical protein
VPAPVIECKEASAECMVSGQQRAYHIAQAAVTDVCMVERRVLPVPKCADIQSTMMSLAQSQHGPQEVLNMNEGAGRTDMQTADRMDRLLSCSKAFSACTYIEN